MKAAEPFLGWETDIKGYSIRQHKEVLRSEHRHVTRFITAEKLPQKKNQTESTGLPNPAGLV